MVPDLLDALFSFVDDAPSEGGNLICPLRIVVQELE